MRALIARRSSTAFVVSTAAAAVFGLMHINIFIQCIFSHYYQHLTMPHVLGFKILFSLYFISLLEENHFLLDMVNNRRDKVECAVARKMLKVMALIIEN